MFTIVFEYVVAGLVCSVCETENILTSQYTVYSEIPFNRDLYHTETNQVIWIPMQSNWMVLIDIRSLTRKGLDFFEVE